METPAHKEWKLSLLLFFLGSSALLIALVLGFQAPAAPAKFRGVWLPLLSLLVWGAIALWLAFRVRTGSASNRIYYFAITWLAVAMTLLYSASLANA